MQRIGARTPILARALLSLVALSAPRAHAQSEATDTATTAPDALVATATTAPIRTATAAPTRTSTSFATHPLDARGLVHDPRDDVTGADVALFVPRLVLMPVGWVLTGVAWPVREGLRFVEDVHLVEQVRDLLYNDARTAAIIPILALSSNNGVTIGATAFHDDLLGHDERAALTARFLGLYIQSYELEFAADHFAGTFLWLEGQIFYQAEPELTFYGLGNAPRIRGRPTGLDPYAGRVETEFREDHVLTRVRVGTVLDVGPGVLKLGGSVMYNHRRYAAGDDFDDADDDLDDRPLAAAFDTTRIYGFDEGTDLVEVTGDVVLDLRSSAARTARGVFVEAFVGGVPRQGPYGYLHWGAEVVGYLELFRATRVLALRVAMEAVEGESPRIPFSELPRLGGPYRLRGHDLDAYRDEKAVLASIEYHYPIHRQVRGAVFFDVGRVASDYDLFGSAGVRPWKVGGGGGLILSSDDSDLLRVDVSYGDGLYVFLTTETLGEGHRRRAERP